MQEVKKGISLCGRDIWEPTVFSAQFFCKLTTAPNIFKKMTRTKSGELKVTFTPGKLT